jgi:hypothetical protein
MVLNVENVIAKPIIEAPPSAEPEGRQPFELIGRITDRVLAGLRPARLGARKAGGGRSDEGKGSPPADHSDDRSA